MTDIALYNLLWRIPNATDDEVEKAVTNVASSREMATKADLKSEIAKVDKTIAELKSDIREIRAELKYLRWLIVIVVGIAVGIIKYL